MEQFIWPTADVWLTGTYLYVPAEPAEFWSKVIQDPPDDDETYARMISGGYQWAYLASSGFNLPPNAINIVITVHIRARRSGMNISQIAGGVADLYPYPVGAVASGATQPVPSTLYNDFVFTLPQNEIGPFQAWTPEAVNAIGIITIRQEANTAGTAFTQVYAKATYDLADQCPECWPWWWIPVACGFGLLLGNRLGRDYG